MHGGWSALRRHAARGCLWASVVAPAAMAAPALPTVRATLGDPFAQCAAVEQALPKSVDGLPRLGSLTAMKRSGYVAEYCGREPASCRRAQASWPGLTLDVLEVRGQPTLSLLSADLTTRRWRLLQGVQVGQPVSTVLSLYGVQAPDNRGEFNICGEAVCLMVAHREGQLTRLHLDCQRAW